MVSQNGRKHCSVWFYSSECDRLRRGRCIRRQCNTCWTEKSPYMYVLYRFSSNNLCFFNSQKASLKENSCFPNRNKIKWDKRYTKLNLKSRHCGLWRLSETTVNVLPPNYSKQNGKGNNFSHARQLKTDPFNKCLTYSMANCVKLHTTTCISLHHWKLWW